MAGFSGAIKLAEMNDYLSMNQSCIKPLLRPGAAGHDDKEKANSGTRMRVELEFSSSDASDLRFPGLAGGGPSSLAPAVAAPGHFDQMKLDPVKKSASVSLNDCLACSGCVTSAETVLITQQSTQEFLAVLAGEAQTADSDAETTTPAPKRTVVVSLSPQSLAALAHEFKLTPLVCAKKLTTFFVRVLGCAALVDTTPALDMALLEAREEFLARYRWSQARLGGHALPAAPAAVSEPAAAAAAAGHTNTVSPSPASPLPLLASECPGWICYCEKTQGVDTLSHVSSVRSAQGIMGALLKQWWCPSRGIQPASLFHTSVQPCYDKKLEGSRDDFFLEQFSTRETDCVLTTGEVADLIRERCDDFAALDESPLDADFFNVTPDQSALYGSIDVGGSGGYCELIFRHAAQHLFGITFADDAPLPYQAGRNPDFRELTLQVQGKTVLNFALAYGFRNIQNLVRKMKTKRPGKVALPASAVRTETGVSENAAPTDDTATVSLPVGSGGYHYVEVMACPSGCLNGGGQVKAVDIRSQKQLVQDLDVSFHQRTVCRPEDNVIVQKMYKEWLQASGPFTGQAREKLHTQYHAVEKELANPLGIKW